MAKKRRIVSNNPEPGKYKHSENRSLTKVKFCGAQQKFIRKLLVLLSQYLKPTGLNTFPMIDIHDIEIRTILKVATVECIT